MTSSSPVSPAPSPSSAPADIAAADPRSPVVLCWHMHQPDYRIAGVPRLPWTYLRALREYSDMAAHLEALPTMRAVVNFTPVLLDQLQGLAQQARAVREGVSQHLPALLAALLASPGTAQLEALIQDCLRADPRNGRRRYPAFDALLATAEQAARQGPAALRALPLDAVDDLVMWTHLVWLPESLRGGDARVQALMRQGRRFSVAQRRELLERICELLEQLLPRYRALAASGRVELAVSPYFHPLLPLLLDFASAHEVTPGIPLPVRRYPHGEARVRWQLRAARDRFRSIFGQLPRGCWPSELAVSEPVLGLIEEAGFGWTLASESLQQARPRLALARLPGHSLPCFFRDDELSDRIGFDYEHWHAAEAVADLLRCIEARSLQRPGEPVVLALDGENAWEHYADNGIDFLRGLYAALVDHPRLRPCSFSDCLEQRTTPVPELPRLAAGSWAGGDLRTWIGNAAKNHVWDQLIDAKQRYDAHAAPSPAALFALGACEGSDWYWWAGSDHPGPLVADFERLFRARLHRIYDCLGFPPPDALAEAPAAIPVAAETLAEQSELLH